THTLHTYTSVGRHCIIYRFTLLFTATIKGSHYEGETEGQGSVRKCKKLMGRKLSETGFIEETAGVVEAGNRGYSRGVGGKENESEPHSRAI
ncbi:hypothetical protein DVA76_18270, partial [Acinetobacter baumannii]